MVAANDMLAIGCYGALDELGLRCPEDVSVIGFNDMPFVDRLRPPLSSVRFPHYQLGTEAATLLIERIEAAESPVKILFLAPELVARGSTAPLAGGAARGRRGPAAAGAGLARPCRSRGELARPPPARSGGRRRTGRHATGSPQRPLKLG